MLPTGQPLQVGAFNFFTTSCLAVTTHNAFNALAFVDTPIPGCPSCGTRSLSLNLAKMLSLNPQPGQYDVQSILTHEFGHMLGLWHMTGGSCGNFVQNCAGDPNLNTMSAFIMDGETCQRDLAFYDILNANTVY